MRGIKIPQQDFVLKTQGGGAYLRDTTVNSLPSPSYTAGHEPSEHSSHTPLSPMSSSTQFAHVVP